MRSVRPVVLLGPGRGGTTLLYKLLALHPDAAFISNYDTRRVTRPFVGPANYLARRTPTVRRAAWFSEDGQAYLDRRRFLKRFIPAPVEGEQLFRECGLTLNEYLNPGDEETANRLRRTLGKIQRRHRGTVLFVKRTANNRRIPVFASALPDARFVVLWRDGRAVTSSLMNVWWWQDHRLWWAENKSPRELRLDRRGTVEYAAKNWAMEVAAIQRGLAHVRNDSVLQLRYEDLLADPRGILSTILEFVGLPPSAAYQQDIAALGIRPQPESWRRSLNPDELRHVDAICGSALRDLKYC